jgi:hypothetical protein
VTRPRGQERPATWWWRPVEWAVRPLVDSYSVKKYLLIALIFAGLVLLVFLGSLEQLLRDLHEPGGERASTAALANDLGSWPSTSHFREILDRWGEAAVGQGEETRLPTILATYALADLVFVLVYTTLGGMLLVMLMDELGPGRRGQEDLTPYRGPVRIALGALGLLAVVDIVENLTLLATALFYPAGGWDTLFSILAWGAFRAKTALVLVVLVPGIVAVLTFLARRPDRRKGIWPALVVARGQLLVLVLLVLGLFVSDQGVDSLRQWSEDSEDAFFAILVLGWLAGFMLVSTDGLLDSAGRRKAGTASEGTFLVGGVFVTIAALVAWLAFDAWVGLTALALLLLAIWVLSVLVASVPVSGDERELHHAERWLPLSLGLFVLLLPVLALVDAAAGPLVLGYDQYFRLLGFAAILVLVGAALAWLSETVVRYWKRDVPRRGFYALSAFLVGAIWVSLVADPWETADIVGAVGFLGAFLLGLALVLLPLIRRAEDARPPDIFALVRFRCTPVILLALVWVAAGSLLDRESTYHNVRTLGGDLPSTTTHRGLSAQEVFRRWRMREPATTTARPLLFVAAAGGGIRAAYWTATVLACVLDGQAPSGSDAVEACSEGGSEASRRGRAGLFAASGASGGSVGLASYATHLVSPDVGGWPGEQLDDDYASMVVGWGLFVDIPSTLFRREGGSDRAEMLERWFERSWLPEADLDDDGSNNMDDSPFAQSLLEPWFTPPRRFPMPLLLLNSTKVQQGCRLNVSVLDVAVEPKNQPEAVVDHCVSLRLFEAGRTSKQRKAWNRRRAPWILASSDDLMTYLCGREDLRLSTAAMLSARFPYALPSGNLRRAVVHKGRCKHIDTAMANAVDGGYFDTSGASPIVELWTGLERAINVANDGGACIVPYFLQIDTGYADPVKQGDGSPSELLIPPVGAIRARDAREHNARQAAALLFTGKPATGPGREDRYAHIYPRAHAGLRAPLGWTLSGGARAELEKQLENPENLAQIAEVREWLTSADDC